MTAKNTDDPKLPQPQQLTIGWLIQHVPLAWWWSFAFLIVSVFGVGCTVGNSEPLSRWIQHLLENRSGKQSTGQETDNLGNLKEIRNIVNCRIDLSTNVTVKLPEHGTKSGRELARTRARIQMKSEQTAVIGKLLNEIDRVTMQVSQMLGDRAGMELGPFPVAEKEEFCRR